ncbi:helix-turn-helix transcriptional regulator [Mycetohabitans endofungorum]|uniref:helix-turn-helix transcriptional regulator n=1 Tax=Mycetohabitans endofungorum TaxID=417203 RepID=UPI002B053CF6|nr:addiction module antidote protein, HigA family [Mycetohabitans endofungorum]
MSRMFNPPHPGATLREDVLPALGLTVTQAAQQLGVERGGRADVWLAGQAAYDLWQARHNSGKPHVKHAPAEPTR